MVSLNPINVIAKLPPIQSAVKWASAGDAKNLATLQKHLPAIEGLWISLFYVINTMKSKGIPKERKAPLAINSVLTGIFGATGGYLLTKQIFKLSAFMQKRAAVIYQTDPAKLEIILKGLKAVVPLFAFTFVFRYLGPVIATPLADKANKYLIKHKLIKDPKASEKEAIKDITKQNTTITTNNNIENSFLAKTGFNVNV